MMLPALMTIHLQLYVTHVFPPNIADPDTLYEISSQRYLKSWAWPALPLLT